MAVKLLNLLERCSDWAERKLFPWLVGTFLGYVGIHIFLAVMRGVR